MSAKGRHAALAATCEGNPAGRRRIAPSVRYKNSRGIPRQKRSRERRICIRCRLLLPAYCNQLKLGEVAQRDRYKNRLQCSARTKSEKANGREKLFAHRPKIDKRKLP